jgi:hypothetical protein
MEPREQLVDTQHLKPGPLSFGIGIGSAAVGIGLGALLLCWGLSWLWSHAVCMAEMANAKPDIQRAALAPDLTSRTGRDGANNETASAAGANERQHKIESRVIRRQVTEFRRIDHEAGEVTSGWQYADGRGGVPLLQYCYYMAYVPGQTHKSEKIEIALNGKALSDLDAASVPDLEGARAKCQWWTTREEIGVSSHDTRQAGQQQTNKP